MPAQQKKSRLRFTAFDAAEINDEPEFLIEGILPREGIGVMYAPPKAHKTFTALDMAMHIALGRPYRGRAVQYGAMIYNVFEGQHGFLKRAVAYRRHHLKGHVAKVPLLIQSTRLNLAKDVTELIIGIQAEDIEPALVILDTLNRSLVGSESKDADMAGYLAAADKLRETFHCMVLIVHHCGLEHGRPRGHTSLTGAADVQISIKLAGDTSVLTVEFLKDGEEGTQLYSKLESWTLATAKPRASLSRPTRRRTTGPYLSGPKPCSRSCENVGHYPWPNGTSEAVPPA